MRKRWQEAISSRESMTTELAAATTPLLKQISTLQDSLRSKSESWQAVETTLTERALRAESAAEIAQHKKSVCEEQLVVCKSSLTRTQTQLTEMSEQLRVCESDNDRLKRAEAALLEKLNELESRMQLEAAAKASMTTSMREMELRHRNEVNDVKTHGEDVVKALKLRVQQLESELQHVQSQSLQDVDGRGANTPSKKGTGAGNRRTMNSPGLRLDWSGINDENDPIHGSGNGHRPGGGTAMDGDVGDDRGAGNRNNYKPLPDVLPSKWSLGKSDFPIVL
jgi:DNA repair exonuclease SbcCD ATPase subunit